MERIVTLGYDRYYEDGTMQFHAPRASMCFALSRHGFYILHGAFKLRLFAQPRVRLGARCCCPVYVREATTNTSKKSQGGPQTPTASESLVKGCQLTSRAASSPASKNMGSL